ncbi:DciA family protein [Streptomyces lincolnensis]|uniref:DciA family protein n=1 Tax=Streptomyces lincolnensis TaxID=1915 RepID=UPI0037D7D28E
MTPTPEPGQERIDLARVMLRRAKEDARLHRFTERSAAPRQRHPRGYTPAVHIAQALLDLFAGLDMSPLPAWQSVAGPMARHVHPTAFDAETGTLTLASSSAAWLTNIRLCADALVQRLNAELGPGAVRVLRLVKRDSSAPLLPGDAPEGAPRLLRQPVLTPDPAVRAALQRQAHQLPREPVQHR